MKRVYLALLALSCAAIGWLGSTVERQAHAQVTPPRELAGEWKDMGEANGVQAWRFVDGGTRCYVTSNGGISCK